VNPTPLEQVLANSPSAGLSLDELVRAFIRDLVHAAAKLEEGAKNHRVSHEDAITDTLLAYLYAMYDVHHDGDANGHVDICVKHRVNLALVLKGEAKAIGPKLFDWYCAGLIKLVGKYNTGRNDIALMVCYCRLPDMHTVMSDYQKRIEVDKTADFVDHVDPAKLELAGLKGLFVTAHKSSGRTISVAHVWINMHSPTDDELFAAEKAKRAK
jgi:hypothetical protein